MIAGVGEWNRLRQAEAEFDGSAEPLGVGQGGRPFEVALHRIDPVKAQPKPSRQPYGLSAFTAPDVDGHSVGWQAGTNSTVSATMAATAGRRRSSCTAAVLRLTPRATTPRIVGAVAAALEQVNIRAVTPDRWADLEGLFERRAGPRGRPPVTSACWCMFWRLERAQFERNRGKGETRGLANKAGLRARVEQDREPGVLAYVDGQAVGWCSIAPRDEFVRLDASTALRRVDAQPVWSIVCFYIDPRWRGRGVATALIQGAVQHARSRGARIVEAYPSRSGDGDPYTGLETMFSAAGFTEVRPGRRRSIWRLDLSARS